MPRKHSWRVRIRAEWRKGEECIWREGIGAGHCATDPSAISEPIQQLTPDFGCPPLAEKELMARRMKGEELLGEI